MSVEFTGHNILLDNGVQTRPESGFLMAAYPWFVSARRILETVFPGDKGRFRIADLGCLEGGYAVEFARMGFQVLGVEVRESNIAACRYVKANTNLPNLQFVQDDAWNIGKYGSFDAVFCCGLLYHLDHPKQFLGTLSGITKKLLILQTHFSIDTDPEADDPNSDTDRLRRFLGQILPPFLKGRRHNKVSAIRKFNLSPISENESLRGRWYTEFATDADYKERERSKWASWDNRRSFWVQREYLLQAIQDVGFDLVMEQFDGLGEGTIANSMICGYYKADTRGTFIGIKTPGVAGSSGPA
jgi:SAM-dependent methyltransferase